MTTSELRSLALVIKRRVEEMREAISPAYNEVFSWALNADDSHLPTIAQVKAVIAAYEAFSKPSLMLYDEIRAVKASEDEATALPNSLGVTVGWADVQDKPDVSLSGHTHVKADITNFAHTHVKADITDFPLNLKAAAQVYWIGNGAANRVITLPFALLLADVFSSQGLVGRIVSTGSLYKSGSAIEAGAFSLLGVEMTIVNSAYNASGVYFNLLLIGA